MHNINIRQIFKKIGGSRVTLLANVSSKNNLDFLNIWSGSHLKMGRAENLIDILRLFVAVLQMSILQKEQKLVFDISWFLPQKHLHT